MTEESPRKKLIQLSGGCLIVAILSAIVGLIMGQYGIFLYIIAAVSLILSFVVFSFARKYPETPAEAASKVSSETSVKASSEAVSDALSETPSEK
ncbi:MAG TPA: hypothetical protein O0X97_03525 [Methanocorpusculum sp.]|nr:hypothetical protein [Methanocorpusculum sp.]